MSPAPMEPPADAPPLSAEDAARLAKFEAARSAGQPLPLMQHLKLKHALKAAHGVGTGAARPEADRDRLEAAFARYRAALDLHGDVALVRAPLTPFRTLAEAHAEIVHVIHPGGEEAVLHAPPAIGEAATATLTGRTRRVELALFRGATAFAHTSTVRLKDGTFVFDVQDGETGRLPVDSAFDPLVFHDAGDTLHMIDNRRPADVMTIPEAIALMGASSMSFGHWMGEEFLKFLSLRRTIDIGRIPILIDAAMPRQHRQSIRAFTGPRHPIIEVPRGMRVEAERLWVMTNWAYSPKIVTTDVGIDPSAIVVPPKTVAAIMGEAGEELAARLKLDESAPPAGRIFLARNPARHRAMDNHEAVAATLAEHGFVETRPETLSFVDQFKLYRGAGEIVVQTGSASIGLVLCRPGTRVCLLSHPSIERQGLLAEPLKAMGIDFVALVGETGGGDALYRDRSTYSIDDAALRALIAAQLKVPATSDSPA